MNWGNDEKNMNLTSYKKEDEKEFHKMNFCVNFNVKFEYYLNPYSKNQWNFYFFINY